MTDDIDPPSDRAVSLPVIDSFAALEAELAEMEERVERLEAELAAAPTPPSTPEPRRSANPAPDDEEADGTAAEEADDIPVPENWEPETDPLTDTGGTREAEPQGVTPEIGDRSTASADAGSPAEEPTEQRTGDEETPEPPADGRAARSEESTGLKPVRTEPDRPSPNAERERSAATAASTPEAESGETEPESESTAASTSAQSEERPSEENEEYGVVMETSSDLTGGSLGSSAGSRGADDSEGSTGTASASESPSDATSGGTAEGDDGPRPNPTGDRGERLSLLVRRAELRSKESVVETFADGIDGLDEVTTGMLAHYRAAGEATPVEAHLAAGGSGERQYAYARNRTLRTAGVVEHDSAGRYRYCLPALVEEAFDGHVDGQTLANAVAEIEDAAGLSDE